jgi:hypothetical protein
MNLLIYGAPGWNRTSDPQLRRLMLYPTELRAPLERQALAAKPEAKDSDIAKAKTAKRNPDGIIPLVLTF